MKQTLKNLIEVAVSKGDFKKAGELSVILRDLEATDMYDIMRQAFTQWANHGITFSNIR